MAQQGQPGQQGWLSSIMNQRNPFAQFGTGMCSPSMGNSQYGQYGNVLPFGADPVSAAYAQQAQLAQQQGQSNSPYSNQGAPYGGEQTLH